MSVIQHRPINIMEIILKLIRASYACDGTNYGIHCGSCILIRTSNRPGS